MSVLQALKNSPKGQLQYTRSVGRKQLKHDLEKLSPVPLSRSHDERESSKLNLSFGLDPASFNDTDSNGDSPGLSNFNQNSSQSCVRQDIEDKMFNNRDNRSRTRLKERRFDETEKQDLSKEDLQPFSESTRPNATSPDRYWIQQDNSSESFSCPGSPLFGNTSKAIADEEDAWDSAHRLRVQERIAEFEKHERAINELMKQKMLETNRKQEQQAKRRQQEIERQMQQGMEETEKILQKCRENREEHKQKIVSKSKEIQRQKMQLEEEERKRQAVKAGKLQQLKELLQQIEANKQEFGQLQDSFQFNDRFPEIIGKCRTNLEKICTILATQVQAAEHTSAPLDEVINMFEGHREKSKNFVLVIKKEIVNIEAKVKEEEEQKKETEKKQQEEVKAKQEEEKKKEEAKRFGLDAGQDFAVQSLAHSLREYQSKLQKVAQVDAAIQNFVLNPQMKKYRFDLQRAVNLPINAISAVSGSHLRDKLQKLYELLNGQMVSMANKNVSTRDSPDAPAFCQNLIAKMLVRKGEEQVTSLHESAFAIGAVVIGLWSQFPIVGELFMGHLVTLCPYVLPFHCPRQEGQTSADYHRSLGYKVSEDGTVEEQDKFLRRMSGLMRLYCACLVATPLKGPNTPHPHGLENAWGWLARTMNLEPQPDITAAMVHDILSVTGHALLAEYNVQFVKLIFELHKHFLPKLKSVSVTHATVGRLEIFLETALKNNGRIPPPEGLLPKHFWTT